MKYKFRFGFLMLTLATAAWGQTAFYVNDDNVICPPGIPPQINATNFINNNFFSINFTSAVVNAQVYKTANTLNFTNNGLMVGNTGFEFDTGPTGSGQRRMADSFNNAGTISSGSSVNNTNTFFTFFFGIGAGFGENFLPKLIISATNVVSNSGTNIVGFDGLFALTGRNVNLNRSVIALEGFDDTLANRIFFNNFFFFFSPGIFDAYWGTGNNVMNPFFEFELPPPTTPGSTVRTPTGTGFQQLTLPNAVAYVNTAATGPTNQFVRAVFLSNTNSAISNNVYFNSAVNISNIFFNVGDIAVEWLGFNTNLSSGAVTTNYLYLFDDFGFGGTNGLFTNISIYTGLPTSIPRNFEFFRGGPLDLGLPAPPGLPPGTFNNSTVTNNYAAYGAVFAPTTQIAANLPGGQITNLPGRIHISADGILDLTRAKITGLNYLGLKATNHFVGSSRAEISAPLSDISLASTNGVMAITNLMLPSVPRFTGQVDLWSGRWTNDAGGLRTVYHVLFVDSRLSPIAPTLIQDLTLRSTNRAGGSDSIVINDVLNVTRSLTLESQRLTIATNQLPAPTARGELNLSSTLVFASADTNVPGSTPRLQYLTNAGAINSQNAIFFGGSRRSPFYTSNYNEPYIAFVNRGVVTNAGSRIWANYFENSGTFNSGFTLGSIVLESQIAHLTNGNFLAPGDISIQTGDLVVTNHALLAGRTLTLAATNRLTDTGASNANAWAVGKGFNLLAQPNNGDLLGTTILDTVSPLAEVHHLWAGQDRGCSPAGFTNNAALGRLILDGGADSLFTFTGTGLSNSLYVDVIELRNYVTNIDQFGNLELLQIDPNMNIRYADIVAGGVSQAERLNGANGGRLCWVTTFPGMNSTTNLIYPDGSTNTVNAALVQSQNLDSDCDGQVNNIDPTPLFLVTTSGLSEATNNLPYSFQLLAGGGTPSYSWALAPGSTPLPDGLALSPSGEISGTPSAPGTFAFTVRATDSGPCTLTADRNLSMTVQPGGPVLSLAIEHHSPPGARVSWQSTPNSTNYVYYRSSLKTGNWLLLTNFVAPVGGPVSIWDAVATNITRYYRVQVGSP